MYYRKPYSNELYHHGIKGQKWGVRRYQNPDGSLTPAGRKRYYKNSKPKDEGKMEGIYVSALALYLGVWGAAVVGTAIGQKAAETSARKFVNKCDKERDDAPVEKSTGLKRKVTNLPEKEDLKRVNPQYKLDKCTPDSTGALFNCVNCTMALEMRKRGYEVQAKLKASGRDGFAEGKKYFGAKTITVQKEPKATKDDNDEFLRFYNREEPKAKRAANRELADKTIASIKSNSPIGSRGQLCISWNRYSGHSMMYDVTSQGVRLIDGQTSTIYNEKEAKRLLRSCCTAEYQRLDNCKVNYKAIKEAIR